MPSKAIKRLILTYAVCTAAVVALSALSYSTGAQEDVQVTKSAVRATAESFRWAIEWLRVVGGLVAAVIGGVGVVGWYRISIRNKEVENLKSANESWRIRVESQDAELIELKKSREGLIGRIEEKDKTLKDLQARTDLTPMIEMLAAFIKVQEARYEKATSAMVELARLSAAIDKISSRLGGLDDIR